MSIGEDLADARRRAGLTVTQVSKQTCIKETLIRAIERGDYAVCGATSTPAGTSGPSPAWSALTRGR